jgi:hypothetical protein
MRRILLGLALLAGSGFGQEMKMVKVEDWVWKEHPVFKGAQTVILLGDPTKAECSGRSFLPTTGYLRTRIRMRKW